ncbi:phage Gp37/Gp68 family protein [Roseimicrobium gellanilyticum]|nr:phage Gp37/Gp68 family protein [Roseimicrobium gellanilyticum]
MKDTKIEWAHHTFNPWWGCRKVSPACLHCYAETFAKRVGQPVWGSRAPRRFFGDAHWNEPLKWNEEAKANGVRRRVFCASMADVFENRTDLNPWRERLWALIEATPWLDWLLLTKRPENIESMVPWKNGSWPPNVWLGTTVESQEYAEQRLPHLLKHAAAVRFLSCEPLLGPVDLSAWFQKPELYPIDWVIVGGESGHHSRPMYPQWAQDLLHQCVAAKVPFHFKQWGDWKPVRKSSGRRKTLHDSVDGKSIILERVGKKAAGRTLLGRTWDQVPKPRS